MMNALALGLFFTSLVTAGFFNPTPTETQKPSTSDDVIVKDGHRVVVVEFEKDDKHTKVLISPPESEKIVSDHDSSKTDLDEKKQEENEGHVFNPRELVCDAFGKCKHKIASAFEKTKDTAADKAHEVEGEAEKVKNAVSQTAHNVLDKMRDSAGEVKQGAEKVKEEVKEKALEKVEDEKRAKREIDEILHRGRDVGVDVLRYAFSPERLAGLSGVLHLMGFSTAYGMCLWVTFASSSVLAAALPRNQFAVVQSRIYPVYFKAMAYSVGIAILGHLMGRGPISNVGVFQGFNLMASLGMVLVNLLYLEPCATEVMREKMKLEKEEGRGKEGHVTETSVRGEDPPVLSTAEIGGRLEKQQEEIAAAARAKSEMLRLSEKLQKLNSYSSFVNVLTLMSLTGHLVHLGQRVHLACV